MLDSSFFILLWLVVYFCYDQLNFNRITLFFTGFAFSLHLLGRFGFFYKNFFGYHFDVYTHTFASFAMIIFVYFALEKRLQIKSRFLFFVILLLLNLGVSTVGEFVEFTGTLMVEDGQGFIALESDDSPNPKFSSDYWDTMTDLLHNTLGALIGILFLLIVPKKYFV